MLQGFDQPEEVAELAGFLGSERAGSIAGQVMTTGGGGARP
jgi:hypothetical protein